MYVLILCMFTQDHCKCVMLCITRQTTHIHTRGTKNKKKKIYFYYGQISLHSFTAATKRWSWQMMWKSRCMCVYVMQITCSTYNICSAWSHFSELLPIYIPAWWFQSVHFDKSYNNLHKGRPTHRTTKSRKPSDRGWPVVQQNENRWARQLEKEQASEEEWSAATCILIH